MRRPDSASCSTSPDDADGIRRRFSLCAAAHMEKRTRESGVGILDLIVVLGLVAGLIFVASLEFGNFETHEPAAAASE